MHTFFWNLKRWISAGRQRIWQQKSHRFIIIKPISSWTNLNRRKSSVGKRDWYNFSQSDVSRHPAIWNCVCVYVRMIAGTRANRNVTWVCSILLDLGTSLPCLKIFKSWTKNWHRARLLRVVCDTHTRTHREQSSHQNIRIWIILYVLMLQFVFGKTSPAHAQFINIMEDSGANQVQVPYVSAPLHFSILVLGKPTKGTQTRVSDTKQGENSQVF